MNFQRILTFLDLYEAINTFEGCPLKQYATNTVIGDGNPTSGVVIIGEAPGAQEDITGKPFVGRSGHLLDKLLGEIGLNRTNVFITNTVFWRPPDNRLPTRAEIESCKPLLERHIALLRPRMLILVGSTAAKTLLHTQDSLGMLRGRWHNVKNPYLTHDIPALSVFHPAYLLRHPPATAIMRDDLKMIQARLSLG